MNEEATIFKQIAHQAIEYWDSVRLRYEVLRLPLKLDYSYSQLIAENEDFHLGAYQNDALSACLILTPVNETKIRMRQVAVAEKRQGRGIGKGLVQFSEGFAKEKGFSEMVLHARETAIPFYEGLGYSIYDEPFLEVGIPHRKMRKALN